jgi:hypothetical protein
VSERERGVERERERERGSGVSAKVFELCGGKGRSSDRVNTTGAQLEGLQGPGGLLYK